MYVKFNALFCSHIRKYKGKDINGYCKGGLNGYLSEIF